MCWENHTCIVLYNVYVGSMLRGYNNSDNERSLSLAVVAHLSFFYFTFFFEEQFPVVKSPHTIPTLQLCWNGIFCYAYYYSGLSPVSSLLCSPAFTNLM